MNNARPDESSKLAVSGDGAGLAPQLNRLHELLQRQLTLVRADHLAAAVALFDETDRCVRQIVEARGLETPEATPQWQGLERLYQELSLVLAVQRTGVSTALDAARRGRSMLKTYGSHLAAP